jgi:hypothetical protein
MHDLDAIDIAILKTLQNDGRISNAALAERVGLSPSPARGGSTFWRNRASSRAIMRACLTRRSITG